MTLQMSAPRLDPILSLAHRPRHTDHPVFLGPKSRQRTITGWEATSAHPEASLQLERSDRQGQDIETRGPSCTGHPTLFFLRGSGLEILYTHCFVNKNFGGGKP